MTFGVFPAPGPNYVAWVSAPVHDLIVIAHGSKMEKKKMMMMRKAGIRRYSECK